MTPLLGCNFGSGSHWFYPPRCLDFASADAQSRLMPPKRSHMPASFAPVAQLSLFVETASLARIHPAENKWRFYRMEIWPDLLGGVLLMRQ
jgi:microcystin degradation protein MlrC